MIGVVGGLDYKPKPTQEVVDEYYLKSGPCCAGCDYWRWVTSLVGECVRFSPNQSHDAAAGLGMDNCTLPRSTTNLTKRERLCGEFVDTFDWHKTKPA